jgi:putative Mn2+ efflux pump MntP
MTKWYSYAGILASVILIAFGAGALYMGFDGRDRVRDDLAREQIVGTEDSAIAGQKVDTGSEAQEFAATIRKHTLEATGGKTYSQMDRDDPQREMWVTSTALSTALNTAYFAESVATFAIVMGVAMLLTGLGFLVLTLRVLRPATRSESVRAAAVPNAG